MCHLRSDNIGYYTRLMPFSLACVATARFAPASYSLRVASEKIRHMETESKEMLAAAEVREKEASTLQEGTREAQERAQAHEMALANALEQVGYSSSLSLELYHETPDSSCRQCVPWCSRYLAGSSL